MGKRNKRARTILKRMSMLGEVPSLDTARRYGIEKQKAEAARKRKEAAAKKKAEAAKAKKQSPKE
jgi:hypothetical protein